MSSIVSDNITNTIAASIRQKLHSFHGFHSLREEGLNTLEGLGLPGNKSEEYKHTPLTRLLEKNFDFAKENIDSTLSDTAQFLIPGMDASIIVLINGVFSPEHSTLNQEPGLTVLPLGKAAEIHGDLVNKYIGRVADHKADAFAAWNTAVWQDGLFIRAEAGRQISRPIIIHHVHDTGSGQVISAVRNLVIVERSAEVTILEKFDTAGTHNGFSSIVSEAVVDENAQLDWYTIQNDTKHRYHFELRQVNQARSSRVNTFTFTLNGRVSRNNLQLALDGEGIDSHMYGLYLIGSDTIADNHTIVDHKQPHSFSNELYKGIIDDSARGVFNGKIFVRPNAQKTNAFQANRNILLTDQATINTKPQLEIWADDVKCSHGCTSGQLDEEAVFYLRARGIHHDTARAMMLYAFAGEVLENIKHPALHQYIDALVSERLHKNF